MCINSVPGQLKVEVGGQVVFEGAAVPLYYCSGYTHLMVKKSDSGLRLPVSTPRSTRVPVEWSWVSCFDLSVP